MEKIMENAVGMITVGIEDYLQGSEYRKYSAVRNVYAGILLLYKAYLYRITPENGNQGDLIYSHDSDVDIDGNLSATYTRKIKKNKTIGFHEIKKLLKKIGYNVQKDKLNKLNELRCDIEHLYVNKELKNVDEIFYYSTSLIADFYFKKLNYDPCEDFEEEKWNSLIDRKKDFGERIKSSIKSFSNLQANFPQLEPIIGHMRCQSCRSRILHLAGLSDMPMYSTAICDNCGNKFQLSEIMDKTIEDVYGASDYTRVMDGENPIIVACPDCWGNYFSTESGACLACGYEQEYSQCPVCHNPISIDEQEFNGICARCAHRAEDD